MPFYQVCIDVSGNEEFLIEADNQNNALDSAKKRILKHPGTYLDMISHVKLAEDDEIFNEEEE